MKVWANIRQQVEIDLLSVIEGINVLPEGDFVKITGKGQYILVEEVSAGQHSFDRAIREMTKEEIEVYNAQKTLIKFLESKQKKTV